MGHKNKPDGEYWECKVCLGRVPENPKQAMISARAARSKMALVPKRSKHQAAASAVLHASMDYTMKVARFAGQLA